MKLPEIPICKLYQEAHTTEQLVIGKTLRGENLTGDDNAVLNTCIQFYKEAFSFLGTVDLSAIQDEDVKTIVKFLKSIFNTTIHFQNNIRFPFVYRATIVQDNFLDGNKVRDISFLKNPPIEIIKNAGVLGRANGMSSTRFYCSFHPAVAVTELRPKVGQRIIVAQWENYAHTEFITFPIALANVRNESIKKATDAFNKRMANVNPLIAEIFNLRMKFLGGEFVRDIKVINPKRYEYLYSSFFADEILSQKLVIQEGDSELFGQYDAIIYPSVPYNHIFENLAIVPESVKKLKLVNAKEIEVKETKYGIDIRDIEENKIPIGGLELRDLVRVEDDTLLWSDD